MQRHSVTSLETARSLANGPSWGGGGFPGNFSVSYLSLVYGRSLWAELNGGENSLHWQANMLPLFSIMTKYDSIILCGQYSLRMALLREEVKAVRASDSTRWWRENNDSPENNRGRQ